MTNNWSVIFTRVSVGAAALISMSAAAQPARTNYDNSITDLVTRYSPPNGSVSGTTMEVGNQVYLTGNVGNITTFDFQFYGTAIGASFAGPNVSAQVRFYYNNGPFLGLYRTPGAAFWDSGTFSLGGPTSRSTISFTEGTDFVLGGLPITSSEITWTVQFSGLGVGDVVGLDIYGPPSPGVVFNDIWANVPLFGWQMVTNAADRNAFAARFETPEPSSLALLVLGGLGFMVAGWRIRKH